tara:strand:+ start:950 stop:1306 length:357 start_codon:yes stop_codon:yes gene_type:complete
MDASVPTLASCIVFGETKGEKEVKGIVALGTKESTDIIGLPEKDIPSMLLRSGAVNVFIAMTKGEDFVALLIVIVEGVVVAIEMIEHVGSIGRLVERAKKLRISERRETGQVDLRVRV